MWVRSCTPEIVILSFLSLSLFHLFMLVVLSLLGKSCGMPLGILLIVLITLA